jgi:uncharacterized peroxidase-related enzyme
MAFIETMHPEQADGPVAAMYLRQQLAWGYVPNYAKVFCHRPEVMARWAGLLAEIRRGMDARSFELVTFAAAHALRNSACALAHGKKLREFFSDEDIVAIAQGEPPQAVTEAERAMLRFARQVARDASQVTQGEVDALKAHGLCDAEIFDVAAAVAGRAFFTKLLDALGVEMDSPFLALEEGLRGVLTVGRSIDPSASVVMAAPSSPTDRS